MACKRQDTDMKYAPYLHVYTGVQGLSEERVRGWGEQAFDLPGPIARGSELENNLQCRDWGEAVLAVGSEWSQGSES